jgi:hypothetical protein
VRRSSCERPLNPPSLLRGSASDRGRLDGGRLSSRGDCSRRSAPLRPAVENLGSRLSGANFAGRSGRDSRFPLSGRRVAKLLVRGARWSRVGASLSNSRGASSRTGAREAGTARGVDCLRMKGFFEAGAVGFGRGEASGSGFRPSLRAVTSFGLSMRHSPGRRRSSQMVPIRTRFKLSTSYPQSYIMRRICRLIPWSRTTRKRLGPSTEMRSILARPPSI